MRTKSSVEQALLAWKSAPSPDIVPEITPGEVIPRIIHQTAKSSQALPTELKENIAKLRRANPDWDYRFYDDEAMSEFIDGIYGPRILEFFLRINPCYGAARADMFRYLLMYRIGGVYLDIKSSISRPLSETVRGDDRYLLSHWNNNIGEQFASWGFYPEVSASAKGEFQQWHIVAAAGHPFLRAVIQKVLGNVARYHPVLHGTGAYGVIRTTGPIAYTLAILPLLERYRHRIVDAQQDMGFEYSIYREATSPDYRVLAGPHYSKLTQPVARLSVTDKILTPFLSCLRAVWNAIKSAKNALR